MGSGKGATPKVKQPLEAAASARAAVAASADRRRPAGVGLLRGREGRRFAPREGGTPSVRGATPKAEQPLEAAASATAALAAGADRRRPAGVGLLRGREGRRFAPREGGTPSVRGATPKAEQPLEAAASARMAVAAGADRRRPAGVGLLRGREGRRFAPREGGTPSVRGATPKAEQPLEAAASARAALAAGADRRRPAGVGLLRGREGRRFAPREGGTPSVRGATPKAEQPLEAAASARAAVAASADRRRPAGVGLLRGREGRRFAPREGGTPSVRGATPKAEQPLEAAASARMAVAAGADRRRPAGVGLLRGREGRRFAPREGGTPSVRGATPAPSGIPKRGRPAPGSGCRPVPA